MNRGTGRARAPGVLFGTMTKKRVDIKSVKCPQCREETAWEGNPFRPFCSERCKLIDLGAWASEEYRIAGKKKPAGEDENKGE